MTNWIEHDGGPQPVADDVWVDRLDGGFGLAGFLKWNWSKSTSYRILNQHLIDAARKDGLQKGLKAFDEARLAVEGDIQKLCDAARLEGIRLGLEAAADALQAHDTRPGAWALIVQALRALDPETIAREAADKETAR